MTLDTKALEAANAVMDEAGANFPGVMREAFKEMGRQYLDTYLANAATPSRNDILEEAARALAFYRDAWALGHDNFIEPSQALLADCGDRARAAIRALVKP